jgi:hypothetical protein
MWLEKLDSYLTAASIIIVVSIVFGTWLNVMENGAGGRVVAKPANFNAATN